VRNVIGIRKESKYPTERRAPFTPDQVKDLIHVNDINVIVEPCEKRFFKNEEYERAGALISRDLSECNVIFGIKEIPVEDLIPDMPYCFFSHTIKGQTHNMPMLKGILDRKDTLIDYELVKNEKGKRMIFFGNYAGYAGMIDSLWALGQRLLWEGSKNPFSDIKQTNQYRSLDEAKVAIRKVGANIKNSGLHAELVPFVCGFAGYGHVSKGGQAIFDLLPVETIPAKLFFNFIEAGNFSNKTLYKIEFTKPDMYENRDGTFSLDEFKNHPDRYAARIERFIPHLTMFINGIFWQPRHPRLLTKSFFRSLYKSNPKPRLRVIGDITCDVNGSIEITVKATNSRNPIYVYEPLTGRVVDGWEGSGPAILAVDKLPSEIPLEASHDFGKTLMPFVPQLATVDFNLPLEDLRLPVPFRNAVVAHNGRLTPQYDHLRSHLDQLM
jgi:saccharopine dehydrogenase (NAD+, L-lysine-forming)